MLFYSYLHLATRIHQKCVFEFDKFDKFSLVFFTKKSNFKNFSLISFLLCAPEVLPLSVRTTRLIGVPGFNEVLTVGNGFVCCQLRGKEGGC